ncbi:MAG: response regulator transcription factor [Steroidobacteraceae bacterium]|jgi:FixJ family two-component response regulator
MKELSPTITVIDDDDGVRNALKLLFKSLALRVVTYGSAQDFLAHYVLDQPGCLVVDVRMPGMSGLELQQELNLRGAMIPVIFITGHGDISMAVEAIQQGAFDFLSKPFQDRDLINRVQRAIEKDTANRHDIAKSDLVRQRLESLTPREREVLGLVTSGKANKAMAADLGVSQRTVEIHRARVMKKMQAKSLAQLVRMSLQVTGTIKRS